ncbi:hypothetical protein SRHO_G00289200 [Serrasalmus rhombeus]
MAKGKKSGICGLASPGLRARGDAETAHVYVSASVSMTERKRYAFLSRGPIGRVCADSKSPWSLCDVCSTPPSAIRDPDKPAGRGECTHKIHRYAVLGVSWRVFDVD